MTTPTYNPVPPTTAELVADLLRQGTMTWEQIRAAGVLSLRLAWCNTPASAWRTLTCAHGHWPGETCHRCNIRESVSSMNLDDEVPTMGTGVA